MIVYFLYAVPVKNILVYFWENKLSRVIRRVNNDTLKCKFRVYSETVKAFVYIIM